MKNVLHVTHSWGGGIPVYISDLKKAFESNFNFFVLKCADGRIMLEQGSKPVKKIYYQLHKPLSATEITNLEYRRIVRLILQAYEIDLVHIHITLGHTFDIYKIANTMRIPIIYTVHDYYYICPTFHMVDRNGMHCRGCMYGHENDYCLRDHPYLDVSGFDKGRLKKWRDQFMKVKDYIDYFIFPSFSCKKLFLSYYNIQSKKYKVIYHGISFEKKKSLQKHRASHLRVGILGSMLKHKGEQLIKYILKNIDDQRVIFYHYGKGNLRSHNIVNRGLYERSNIIEMLIRDRIDVILLLSIWPETFSYTLSESMAAGIPPIVTNLGALKERVEKRGIGWVVDYKDPEQICALLRSIRVNRSEIIERCDRMRRLPMESIETMKKKTLSIYRSLLKERAVSDRNVAAIRRAGRTLDIIRHRSEDSGKK